MWSAAPAVASETCGALVVQYAYYGSCASYGGPLEWFGSYGPGFAPAEGWVFAAGPAGGAAPDPTQSYAPSSAPTGALTSTQGALGFAFSEAQATDTWTGGAQFSADDEATAGQILLDQVTWGAPVPSLSGGVLAAYTMLDSWYESALGSTGAPSIDMNTTGIGPVPTAGAIYQVRTTFPGSGASASGYDITLDVSGGYFAGGATTTIVTSDSDGFASTEIYADSSSTDVTVTASLPVGQMGLDYQASPGAAELVGFAAPASSSNADTIVASTAESGSGTISIDEGGDDTAYVGLAGGVYQVLDTQQSVVASLTTDSAGSAGPTQSLPMGSYTVHEVTPPPGYTAAPDQTITVIDGGNAVAHFTGSEENLVNPATLNIVADDEQTGAPLAGATFEILYDALNNGNYDSSLGMCTTLNTGQCNIQGNDGISFLPGEYVVREVGAAPGYSLNQPDLQQQSLLTPGNISRLAFGNTVLGSLELAKSGNDEAYYGVSNAQFVIAGPSPAAGIVGTLTINSTGNSNVLPDLQAGTYTVTETHPPPGYRAVAPFPVAVALGHATTVASVVDMADPASLDIYNVQSGAAVPIVGGVFDVRYDSHDTGAFDVNLGDCTTDAIGACSPAASSGLGLLPGRYEVTEISAPAGYANDPNEPARDIVLTPGGVGIVDFDDPPLVPLSFQKQPVGSYDPANLDLGGAVFDVRAGSLWGAMIATCTTGTSGACTTQATLVAGEFYCWTEVAAPPGFLGGETGCLTADLASASAPVVVKEPGEYVEIDATKVSAADPALLLGGALLDLYRMDGGAGPRGAPAPSGAPALAGGTWVASATSSATEASQFPLQLPGYAYCVVEQVPPAGYLLDQSPHCTGVLRGVVVSPPAPTTIVLLDAPSPPPHVAAPEVPPSPVEPVALLPTATPPTVLPSTATPPPVPTLASPQTVILDVHKYDALAPGSPIAGAVYDLYVVGGPLASPAPSPVPTSPAPSGIGGDSWVARSATDADGNIRFVVPDGHAWCLKEALAPPGYQFDPSPHCTSVLVANGSGPEARIEIPEHPVMVDIEAQKYNSLQPDTGIPGAAYDVFSVGGPAPGAQRRPTGRLAHLQGATFYTVGVTGRDGTLTLPVPAGHAWCLKEAHAPPAYRFDTGVHCTATLGSASALAPVHIALPELPKHLPAPRRPAPHLPLAMTGLALAPLVATGGLLCSAGGLLVWSDRHRRGRPRPKPPRAA